MSKPLRKRSSYLVFSILFIVSFAFAYDFLTPDSSFHLQYPTAPDSSNLSQARSSDSIYQALLTSITNLYNQQRYEECLIVLKQAIAMKPDVSSLQERIIRVEGLIEQQKKTETEYTRMITLADDYFEKKDYLNAKASYQLAIDIKPDDAYAREKMTRTMELLRSNKAQNILYDVTLASADKLFNEGEYDKARSEYENASRILPGEAYPKEKINAIIKIMVDQQVREELYHTAITSGDQFYTSGNFKRSLMEYKKALEQKPEEPYPKARIDELTKILADIVALEEAYTQAITLADQLFADARYSDSRKGYTEALGLKPAASYPAQKIAEIDRILAGIAKTNTDFDKLVNLADSFYLDRNFTQARHNYLLALQIKPNESYPKAMLAKTTAGMGEQEVDVQYKRIVDNADRMFSDSMYSQASEQYLTASQLKPEEVYPKQRIEEIKDLLANREAMEVRYARIIADADDQLNLLAYQTAREGYQQAIAIKPNETYPASKIREIDLILAGIAKEQQLDADYTAAVARGDSLLETMTYQLARNSFQLALSLKPGETYPAQKMIEIDGILAERARLQSLNEQYDEAISQADQLFSGGQWTEARQSYQRALEIKPDETYPAGQLTLIEEKLSEIARLDALNKEYRETIAVAERFFTANVLDSARVVFLAAQLLMPSESLPKSRIAQIDSLLAAIADQQALDERYQTLISSSDNLLKMKDYSGARDGFNQALALKPTEKYPSLKIDEIDGIIAENERIALLELNYSGAIMRGDSLMSADLLIPARGEFEAALALKPSEEYPTKKLSEIDAMLQEIATQQALDERYRLELVAADKLFTDKSWDPAIEGYKRAQGLKPLEEYPSLKIRQIDSIKVEIARLQALDREYLLAITNGEKLLEGKAYDSARINFVSAQDLKPTESLPAVKIAQIDSILIALANQRALDEQFASLIQSSDKLFLSEDYGSAKTGYIQALELKPTERYPAEKVSEIDSILAENARKAALELQYARAIVRGDSLLASDLLTSAREEFVAASGLKPGEAYPKTKLDEIDKALKEAARLQALDKRYKEEVETGDRLFADAMWDSAIAAYMRAKELKPSEGYPGQKLHQIDSIRQEIARQLQIDNQYQSTIADADQLFGARSLDLARAAYVKAGELRPEISYWQEQIEQIDRILAEQKRVNEKYNATITEADALLTAKRYEDSREAYQSAALIKTTESYPREKIKEINQILAEIQGLRETFDKLVAIGDQLFAFKEYYKAKENFQQALDLFPDEAYPKEQLHTINVRIDSIYRANRADYDKAIGEGDGFFNSYEYDKAIDAYTRAITFLPMEDYPRQMIAKIRKTISENAIADVLNQPVIIKAGEEQKFPFDPVNIASRRNNFIYMKVKNLSNNSFNILMRYGKGDQTSGGLAIRNVSTDGEINERLISVKDQDPWYREDNNWISVYPQGGDIEVSFIQVSRAIK